MMLRAVLVMLMLASPAGAGECVVLLHGLARGPASMAVLGWALERAGYRVVNRGYPTTSAPIEALAAHVGAAVDECGPGARVSFVTHSMGGIVLREWLRGHRPAQMGRVVMLAPPNAGSELVDAWGDLAVFGWVNGPAGRQLGTGPDSLPRRLPPVDVPVGVIAGRLTTNPVSAQILPGTDDGKVSVAATHVAGQADHLVIAATHTFITVTPEAIRQVQAFLATGAFSRR